jgi:hypothetical protein
LRKYMFDPIIVLITEQRDKKLNFRICTVIIVPKNI